MSISIIGIIHEIDNTGKEPVITTLDGYHVNSTEKVEGWDKYEIQPESPSQVFYGVKTYFYKFPSEEVFMINSPKDGVDENA